MGQLEDAQDGRDRASILAQMNCVRRCVGGRLVMDGYVCLHCGEDWQETRKCGEPMPNVAFAPEWLKDLGKIDAPSTPGRPKKERDDENAG